MPSPDSVPITETPARSLEPGLADLFIYIRRNRILISSCLAFGLVLGVIAQLLTPKVYEARAKFAIDQIPFETDQGATDAETQRQMVQSLILGLSTDRMQKAVADKLRISDTAIAFREFERPLSLRGAKNRANIRITPIRNSRLGLISVQSQDPEFAVQVANMILEESKILNIVGVQLAEQRASRKTNQADLDVLNQKTSELSVENTRLQEQVEQLKKYTSQGGRLEYFSVFETDATLNNLKTQLMLVESEYQRIASQSTRGSRLEGKAAEVEGLKKQMANHAQNLAISLNTKAASTAESLSHMKMEVDQTALWVRANDRKAAQIMEMLAHPEQASQLSTAMALPAASSNVLVVLDPGYVSPRPVRPIWVVSLSGGALLGLTLGMLLPLFVQAMAVHLTRGEQVRRILRVPFLGYLPEEVTIIRPKISREIFNHPNFSIESEYLRDSICKIAEEHKPPSILAFIPCGPNDTASFTVSELGLQLAEAEKKTLILDLNFDSPRQKEILGLEIQHGLYSWLTSQKPLSDVIHYTAVRELALIHPEAKAEEMRAVMPRRSLSQAIEEEAVRWDFVLLDSHPLTRSSELLLALSAVRQIILVADYGKTRIDNARRTVDRVRRNGWKILGLLIRNCPKKITEKARAA